MIDLPEMIADAVVQTPDEVMRNDRWAIRLGTITVPGDGTVFVQLDGEGFAGSAAVPIPVISLAGYLPVSARVAVLTVPPEGNYVISRTYGPNDSGWTDYSPSLTSTGTQPDVGDGEITGRWMPIGRRTIVVEVDVTWGAGLNQGTGRYFISAPFLSSARSIAAATGACYILDNGTANRANVVNLTSGGTDFFMTTAASTDVGAGIPQTWAAGDMIQFTIIYEVASFDPL